MKVIFKEWVPDAPDFGNPGDLTDVTNAMPVNGSYSPFPVLASSGAAWGATVNGAFSASPTLLYAGSNTALGVHSGGVWTTVSSIAYSSGDYWQFARYEDYVFATNYVDDIQYQSIGSTATFGGISAITASASIPRARQIGVIGQFLVVGDTSRTASSTVNHKVAWSAIDAPLNWPPAGSTTAIAAQSGEQLLPAEYGAVTGIVNGDQHGIILQKAAITRMTYVGGTTVFQFDSIYKGRGAFYPRSVVQVGPIAYFAAVDGFWMTDGVNAKPLGKVDTFFANMALANSPNSLIGAHDAKNKLVWWMYPTSKILFYNYAEDRWGKADHALEFIVSSAPDSAARSIRGFNTSHAPNYFSGASATMTLTSGEYEGNPGGYTYVSGVKPIVGWNVAEGSDPAPAVTVALGYRNSNTGDVTYSAETTANSRSGFCDFRNSARYHRARLTIDPSGALDEIRGLGFEVNSAPMELA